MNRLFMKNKIQSHIQNNNNNNNGISLDQNVLPFYQDSFVHTMEFDKRGKNVSRSFRSIRTHDAIGGQDAVIPNIHQHATDII